MLWYLRVPSAMPYYLGRARIAGGWRDRRGGRRVRAAPAVTNTGLASRILEAGLRLQHTRMFAALC